MTYDALSTVYGVFSDKWPDFKLRKSRKAWVKETGDKVLLLAQIQKSQWGAMYYLNFGAYFLGIEPIDKPMSHLPKTYDWHVFARYEAFQYMSTDDYNALFSFEEADSDSLDARCAKIALFADKIIFPKLRIFGSLDLINDDVASRGSKAAFDPFRTQKITRDELLKYVSEQSRLRGS